MTAVRVLGRLKFVFLLDLKHPVRRIDAYVHLRLALSLSFISHLAQWQHSGCHWTSITHCFFVFGCVCQLTQSTTSATDEWVMHSIVCVCCVGCVPHLQLRHMRNQVQLHSRTERKEYECYSIEDHVYVLMEMPTTEWNFRSIYEDFSIISSEIWLESIWWWHEIRLMARWQLWELDARHRHHRRRFVFKNIDTAVSMACTF